MQKILGSIVAIILLTACASNPTSAPTTQPSSSSPTAIKIATPGATATNPNPLALTVADNGKTITLAPGQIIVINLDSNATTGFKWNLTTTPDDHVLKLVSSNYNAPNNPIPGKGGSEDWKFQAVGTGSTSLKLGYFRPFDVKTVASEFALTIAVK